MIGFLQLFLIFQRVTRLEAKMATVEEAVQAVKDEAAAEKAEVGAKVAALDARVAELEAQLANGAQVTPEQLAEMRSAIQGIYTVPAPNP